MDSSQINLRLAETFPSLGSETSYSRSKAVFCPAVNPWFRASGDQLINSGSAQMARSPRASPPPRSRHRVAWSFLRPSAGSSRALSRRRHHRCVVVLSPLMLPVQLLLCGGWLWLMLLAQRRRREQPRVRNRTSAAIGAVTGAST